jgi:hypothetical protein
MHSASSVAQGAQHKTPDPMYDATYQHHLALLIMLVLVSSPHSSPTLPASSPLLLLRHTDSPTSPASRLAVLSTHPQAPVVPQTTMRADLLQPLEIVTELAVHAVGKHLAVLAVHDVALTIEEPGGDLVLGRVLDDRDDALEFFGGEFAGAVVAVLVGVPSEVV